MSATGIKGLPLVTDSTRAQSENIETILTRLRNKRLIIPDYQRDAEQWDLRKESLFIESLLNNLTVPAFFFSQTERNIEVVDGQQRLSTILKFADDEFAISDDPSMVYLTPQSVHYRGKKFSGLPEGLKSVFNDYPLTIIYLPTSLDLSTKLEIFRRINEGGTPLTPQDIRLAYYSESSSVTIIRLAGMHGTSAGQSRMHSAAAAKGLENPWSAWEKAMAEWSKWWEGKARARGQIPSEMFLWYLVTRNRRLLNQLISVPQQLKHLQIAFRGSTEEALDIYCAQTAYTDVHGGTEVFPVGAKLTKYFGEFASWMGTILTRGMAGVSVDKYKQIALMVAGLTEKKIESGLVSHDAWDALAEFIRTPREAGRKWLKDGYPEQKGRWGGENGQYSQCERACELVETILKRCS